MLAAFAAFLLHQRGVLALRGPDGDAQATERIRTMSRVITDSPALLARERQVFDHYARTRAEVLAEDTGARPDDVTCRTVANALAGLHRALVHRVREQALAGVPAARIRRDGYVGAPPQRPVQS